MNADQILRQMIGDLVVQSAVLQAKIEELTAANAELKSQLEKKESA